MYVDLDNIATNVLKTDPDSSNEAKLTRALDKAMREIASEFGEIVEVFVFLPPQSSYLWAGMLYELGFIPIDCPRIKDKHGDDQDTVDATLKEKGWSLLENFRDLSFLCLASGDQDFSRFLRRVSQKGLKTIVVGASLGSTANALIDVADKTIILERAN